MKDELGRFIDYLNGLGADEAAERFWDYVGAHNCDRTRIVRFMIDLPPRATACWRMAVAWDQCIKRPHIDFPGYAEWLKERATAEVAKKGATTKCVSVWEHVHGKANAEEGGGG